MQQFLVKSLLTILFVFGFAPAKPIGLHLQISNLSDKDLTTGKETNYCIHGSAVRMTFNGKSLQTAIVPFGQKKDFYFTLSQLASKGNRAALPNLVKLEERCYTLSGPISLTSTEQLYLNSEGSTLYLSWTGYPTSQELHGNNGTIYRFDSGVLSAKSAAGKLLWRVQTEFGVVSDLQLSAGLLLLIEREATSGIVSGIPTEKRPTDLELEHTDPEFRGFIVAFDSKSGKRLWRASGTSLGVRTGIEDKGVIVLYLAANDPIGADTLIGIDTKSGRQLWSQYANFVGTYQGQMVLTQQNPFDDSFKTIPLGLLDPRRGTSKWVTLTNIHRWGLAGCGGPSGNGPEFVKGNYFWAEYDDNCGSYWQGYDLRALSKKPILLATHP